MSHSPSHLSLAIFPPLNYTYEGLHEWARHLDALVTPENRTQISTIKRQLASIPEDDWTMMSRDEDEFLVDGALKKWSWTRFLCVAIGKTARAVSSKSIIRLC